MWILKAWYRVLSLYLKNPAARQFIKEQLDTPREMFGIWDTSYSWAGSRRRGRLATTRTCQARERKSGLKAI